MPDEDRDPRLAETRIQPPFETHAEKMHRIEERLVANVTEAEAGRVHVRKRVEEEQAEIQVTLRHDELDLERRKADRPLGPDEKPIQTTGETTVLLVVEERLETRRVPWVVEEIHLRRRIVSEQQTVSDTLRKERFEISTEGDLDLEER